jgi:hypothetical protein
MVVDTLEVNSPTPSTPRWAFGWMASTARRFTPLGM